MRKEKGLRCGDEWKDTEKLLVNQRSQAESKILGPRGEKTTQETIKSFEAFPSVPRRNALGDGLCMSWLDQDQLVRKVTRPQTNRLPMRPTTTQKSASPSCECASIVETVLRMLVPGRDEK